MPSLKWLQHLVPLRGILSSSLLIACHAQVCAYMCMHVCFFINSCTYKLLDPRYMVSVHVYVVFSSCVFLFRCLCRHYFYTLLIYFRNKQFKINPCISITFFNVFINSFSNCIPFTKCKNRWPRSANSSS